MRSICLLGIKVAVEGKGWMVLAIAILKASNHQLVGKTKQGGELDSRQGHENFLCPGRAWFLLLPS